MPRGRTPRPGSGPPRAPRPRPAVRGSNPRSRRGRRRGRARTRRSARRPNGHARPRSRSPGRRRAASRAAGPRRRTGAPGRSVTSRSFGLGIGGGGGSGGAAPRRFGRRRRAGGGSVSTSPCSSTHTMSAATYLVPYGLRGSSERAAVSATRAPREEGRRWGRRTGAERPGRRPPGARTAGPFGISYPNTSASLMRGGRSPRSMSRRPLGCQRVAGGELGGAPAARYRRWGASCQAPASPSSSPSPTSSRSRISSRRWAAISWPS